VGTSFWPWQVSIGAALERSRRISSTGSSSSATNCAGRVREVLYTICAADLPVSSFGALFMSRRTQGRCWVQLAAAMRTFRASLSHRWVSTMPLLCGWYAVVVLW